MANISSIKLPDGTIYTLKDNGALQLTGGSVTGPVTFGDSVSIDEATIGDLIVNGSASFTNNLQANTINGVTVGDSPKFTDTNTIYSAGTGLSLSGTTFNHSNSVTAGTAGTSSATSGATLAVPYVTYDAQGHITGSGTHTHTISGFLTSSSTLDASKLSGAIPSAVTATTQSASDNSTKIATTAYVTTATFKSTTASLTVAGWSNNSQTVTVSGVTASNIVIVSPAPASYGEYSVCGIYCSAQAASSLTFTCSEVPSGALTVNVLYK